MNKTTHICRIRVFAKNKDTFRLQERADGDVQYVSSSRFVFGAAAEADVHIRGTGIVDRHLQVTVKGRELWLENLDSTTPTLVSGHTMPTQGPFPYKPGEVIQLGSNEHVMTIDLFTSADGNTHDDAEHLLIVAQRQIEEKNRRAIEESHNRAEAMRQQANDEVERLMRNTEEHIRQLVRQQEDENAKIFARAKVVANDLLGSAKNEVDLLLKEARVKADAIAAEGEERKHTALTEASALQNEIADLRQTHDRHLEETAHSQAVCERALRKKEVLEREIEKIESAHQDWQEKLRSLETRGAELDARAKKSLSLQREAEKKCAKLEEQHGHLEELIHVLNEQRGTLGKEIKQAEDKCAHWTNELTQLEFRYHSELSQLRKKIDNEHERQLKKHEYRFHELRERENHEVARLQKRLEKFEARRLRIQIKEVYERLWQMISDRAVLYGVANLQDNELFKSDVAALTSQALREEFELRRRDVLASFPASHERMSRQFWTHQTTRFTGWILTLGLLAFMLYSQNFMQKREREPACSAPAAPVAPPPATNNGG